MRENTIHVIDLPDTPALTPVLDRYASNGRPAVQLYEVTPEDVDDDGLWCDLTVNLPDYVLPGDDWTFVPTERRAYLRALEQAGLITEIGYTVPYGNFDQRALMVRLGAELLADDDANATATEESRP